MFDAIVTCDTSSLTDIFLIFGTVRYKFRPAPDNPYLHVPQEDSDGEVEMEEV